MVLLGFREIIFQRLFSDFSATFWRQVFMAKEKSRYFTFLLYPETLPEDWEIKLEIIGVPIAVSPLHDSDKSSVEGQEYKKAHYHCIYIAKNPVTADSVRNKIRKALTEESVGFVQICMNVENTYLYLTHESKDAIAKKKHIYDKADIKLINGFDIDRYVALDAEQKDDILELVCSLIADNDIANIIELRDFVELFGSEYGLHSMKVVNQVLRSHTGLVRLYFDGVYQRRKYGNQARFVDRETGEVLTSIEKKKRTSMSLTKEHDINVIDTSVGALKEG